MSRFLARALAMVPATPPDPAPMEGIGDFGGFGEAGGARNAIPPAGVPRAVIQALARVQELKAEGATVVHCPQGGLELERPCGRRSWFSADLAREMQAAEGLAALMPAGTLPPASPPRAPGAAAAGRLALPRSMETPP